MVISNFKMMNPDHYLSTKNISSHQLKISHPRTLRCWGSSGSLLERAAGGATAPSGGPAPLSGLPAVAPATMPDGPCFFRGNWNNAFFTFLIPCILRDTWKKPVCLQKLLFSFSCLFQFNSLPYPRQLKKRLMITLKPNFALKVKTCRKQWKNYSRIM